MIQRRLFQVYAWLERRIVPDMGCSQTTYSRTVRAAINPDTRWLDIGCGHQLWGWWVPGQEDAASRAALLVGLDPDLDSLKQNTVVDYRVAGLELPFRDGSFTLVTANMVFEHLEDPLPVLAEIRRVLTPGGVCVFHTPNSRYPVTAVGRYFPQVLKNMLVRISEGRAEEDVYPTHYRFNREETIRRLSAQAGFADEEIVLMNSTGAGRILILGPFVVLELLWSRLTQRDGLKHLRSNIVGSLRAR